MPTPRWRTFFNRGMLKQEVEYTSEAPSYPMHPQICCSVPSLLAARPCLTCLDWLEGAQAGKDPSRAVGGCQQECSLHALLWHVGVSPGVPSRKVVLQRQQAYTKPIIRNGSAWSRYQLLVQMRKARQLSDGIVAFLAGRGGRAPSTVVVTHFAQQVAQAEASLFRHLLHQVRADPFRAEPSRYGQNPALPRPECGRLLAIGSPRDERRGVRLLS